MKTIIARILTTAGLGLLVIAPVYLAVLLMLKALGSMKSVLAPIVAVLPAGLQHDAAIALVALMAVGLVVGAGIQTNAGRQLSDFLERKIYVKIPGYRTFRSLTRQVAGDQSAASWLPALVDTDDDALMPAFVVEELADGRYTVFVPSVPTPLAGGVFIYPRDRVHLVDVPFRQALGVVSRWGEGAKDLVAGIR